ncbi:fumarylacetoacetate hydrolase family protein [Aquabacterium lacunae]|nr:fumarylacetoacetate hydrolase family protein [Aquabacterium lacunae]
MRARRIVASGAARQTSWQVEAMGGGWRPASQQEALAWAFLPPPAPDAVPDSAWQPGALALPFQPRSFRDASLYALHWEQASRGYVRRFLPAAWPFTRAYEKLTGRTFPAFKPHPLARQQPVYYLGNPLSFLPSGQPLRWPGFSQALDYELELGAVLARPLRNATPDEALAAIGGFVLVNDWSCRDIQRAEMATGLGPQKSKHFGSSMSAEIVPAGEVLDRIERLQGVVEIDGRVVARCSTAGMLHHWGRTLSFLSQDETLLPGELVATGTLPHGTGMENGHWLRPGQRLHLRLEGVGEVHHEILPAMPTDLHGLPLEPKDVTLGAHAAQASERAA